MVWKVGLFLQIRYFLTVFFALHFGCFQIHIYTYILRYNLLIQFSIFFVDK